MPSSASSTWPRASSRSTPSSCAAGTSSPRPPCRSRRGWSSPTTAETSVGFWTWPSRRPTTRVLPSVAPPPALAGSSSASASPSPFKEPAFPQIVGERLGVEPARVQVLWGDSDSVGAGRGNGGSGALTVGGSAVLGATDKVIARGRRIAARMLEAAPEDIVFRDGRFSVTGTDRGVTLAGVARTAYQPRQLPPGMEPGFSETSAFTAPAVTFPHGCHRREGGVDGGAGFEGDLGFHRARRHLPQRLPRLRGGDRRGDGCSPDRPAHGGGRCRHDGEPHAGRGPDPRGRGPGPRPGAFRGSGLRAHHGPAPGRILHGLRDAPGRRCSLLRRGLP